MPEKAEPIFSSLVGQLYDLDAKIAVLKAERDAVAAELIDKGEGAYCDQSDPPRNGLVVVPTKYSTRYDLYRPDALKAFLAAHEAKKATPALTDAFREAQEQRAKDIAGEHFKALFDRTVLYLPADGFEKLVPKFLTTSKGDPSAAARDLLLHCQIVKAPGAAYVKLPDKPKGKSESGDEES